MMNQPQLQDGGYTEIAVPAKQPRFYKFLFNLIAFVFLLAILTAYLVQHIYVMNVNFKMQAQETKLKELQHENEKLQIKLANHVSLENIDNLAINKLGMQRPQEIEYVIFSKNDLERN